jgi:hypothetical protein
MTTETREVSFSNNPCSIIVNESGNVIDTMLKLPAKAPRPMEVTELGITKDVKLSHATKARMTIVLTVLGICTVRIVAYSKASCPIDVTGYTMPL